MSQILIILPPLKSHIQTEMPLRNEKQRSTSGAEMNEFQQMNFGKTLLDPLNLLTGSVSALSGESAVFWSLCGMVISALAPSLLSTDVSVSKWD